MMVSDEEKRWLVVGIAMNKVAAPVIRNYIKQEKDTHYTNNTYCHGLTTPCTMATLTYHHINADPNLKRLKFQNINNNLHNHGNHKNLYDYNINSSVDLAKLFLPDYLAEFSAFDESLDMSAMLRLLGFNNPAPIFLSPNPSISIQTSADDVRENVRNKWGHCNVTEWTEALFNDCFSKLQTLVRSLGLTGGVEKMALDQLSDWQTKGCQLCMGHAVDQNLLSLVQQDVQEFVKKVKKTEAQQTAIQEAMAQQRTEQTEVQNSIAFLEDQQSLTKLQLEEHDEELKAVLEWKEKQVKENEIVLEKLVALEKTLREELLTRLQGVEDDLTDVKAHISETDERVKQLEENVKDDVSEVKAHISETEERVKQLEENVKDDVSEVKAQISETDERVKQLEENVKDDVSEVKAQICETDERMKQLEENFKDDVSEVKAQISETDERMKQLEENVRDDVFDVKAQISETDERVKQLEENVRGGRVKDDIPANSTVGSFDVKTCRSKLAEHYKRTAKVPTSVWSKKSPVDIHQIYTRLSWVKEEQTPAGSSQCELNNYTDLFTANKNGVVPKRILVQGQTGIGKSTFVKKLAVDWAELGDEKKEGKDESEDTSSDESEDTSSDEYEDTSSDEYEDTSSDGTSSDEYEDTSSKQHEDASEGNKNKTQNAALKKFELVLVINLKEASKCPSLKDVIRRCHIFPEEETALLEGLLNYVTKNQEKVLLVVDSYDEYHCGSNSEIFEIFRGNKLRNCCVLITTRNSKADDLREFKDVHAEITGFSKKDRKAFMRRMLGGEEEAKELRRHLSKKRLIGLTRVPLLLLFFCTLWKKGKLKSFPETKTKLYLSIVQYVLDYSQGKHSPSRFRKVEDFKEILAEIGKVALECLLKDDHVFEYGQLSATILCDESLIIGLLQVTEYAEDLRPAGMVSFIHKSIQEFLAAWFITYRCVPEGNLGGIEQHACSLEDCEALENVFQFICGLSDDGAGKVFQHLTSVRISDPTLDFSKTIPDFENETDVPSCDATSEHERFSNLVYSSFREICSKTKLLSDCLECTGGVVVITKQIFEILRTNNVKELTQVIHTGVERLYQFDNFSETHSTLCELIDVLDLPNILPSATESFEVPSLEDKTKFQRLSRCCRCSIKYIFCFHNGQFQFCIKGLTLYCDNHAKLFTGNAANSIPSLLTKLCSVQSRLKFLTSLECGNYLSSQTCLALGDAIRNCKHLSRIEVEARDDSICDLLEQVPNPSKCSLEISFTTPVEYICHLTSAGAAKLANLLPRFNNIVTLNLDLRNCCSSTVDALVTSITHKTLERLVLSGISLTPAAAAALGQTLPEMSSLQQLELTGGNESQLKTKEMEVFFGRLNKTLPLFELILSGFSVRGCITPLVESLRFFPDLTYLELEKLNIDELDQCGLLESLRLISNITELRIQSKLLGHVDRCTVGLTLTSDSFADRSSKRLTIDGISLTSAVAAALSRLLSEMSSLNSFSFGVAEDARRVLETEELIALFGGLRRPLPLCDLTFHGSRVRGSIAPLTDNFRYFPTVRELCLGGFNVDEHNLCCLLDSLRFVPHLMKLTLLGKPLSYLKGCTVKVNTINRGTNKALKILVLREISLSPAAATALGRVLPEMLALEELKLEGVHGSILQAEEMEALFSGFKKTLPLKHLSLSGFNITDSLAPLTNSLRFFPNLSALNLGEYNRDLSMNAHDLCGLLESLKFMPNLKTLGVKSKPLSQEHCCTAKVNTTASIAHKSLEELNLDGISLTPAVAAVLGRLLPELKSLNTLKVTGVDVSILQTKEVEMLFGRCNKTLPLRKLTFSGFNIRGCLAPLFKCLKFFSSLRELNLEGFDEELNVNGHNLCGLLESLQFMPYLKTLNIWGNPLIQEQCCTAEVNTTASITHKTLENLILDGISLSPAVATALGRLLPKMPSLHQLELTGVCGSVLQAEQMEALFGGFKAQIPLHTLKFSFSCFSVTCCLAPLTKSFRFFSSLRVLELQRFNMDEHHLISLLESLSFIPNLKTLRVWGKPLSQEHCCTAEVNTTPSITNKTLERLNLDGISLTPAVAAALGRLLPELSSLETLELTGLDRSIVQVEEMEALFGGLNKTLPLYSLTFRGFAVTGCLAPLTKSFCFFPNLRNLRLEQLNVGEDDVCSLLGNLRFMRNLGALSVRAEHLWQLHCYTKENFTHQVSVNKLNLDGIIVTPAVAAALGRLLTEMSFLQELEITAGYGSISPGEGHERLNLDGIGLTPALAVSLDQTPPGMSFLEERELNGVDGSTLQVEDMKALFGGFNRTLPLTKLYFCGFNVTGCLAPLTNSFRFFPNLRELCLVQLNMDEHDVCSLLEIFKFMPNLKALSVRGEHDLGQACCYTTPCVDKLYLHGIALTPTVTKVLGRELPEMSSLQELELTGGDEIPLQAKEIETLFAGFNKTLPLVRLSFSGFSVTGCLAPITNVFHFFPNLAALNLEGLYQELNMNEHNLCGLLESLRFMPNLKTLSVKGKSLSQEDCCTAEVNTLTDIAHKNLEQLKLVGITLTPRVATVLGQLLPEMLSLQELELIGIGGSAVQAKEMESLFGKFEKVLPLHKLRFTGFSTRGCLYPLTRSFCLFPTLTELHLEQLNMDEHDVCDLLENLQFMPYLRALSVRAEHQGQARCYTTKASIEGGYSPRVDTLNVHGIALTQAVTRVLGRVLPDMSSLQALELTGGHEIPLQAKEIETLFAGFNKTLPLVRLSFSGFSVTGCLAPITNVFHFFPNLAALNLEGLYQELNMNEHNLCGLLESLRFMPNLKTLSVKGKPLSQEDCCTAEVNTLTDIAHKNLEQLKLVGITLTPRVATVLGQLLPEMLSLQELELTGIGGSAVQAKEMESLFGKFEKVLPLHKLRFTGFSTRGCLYPLTRSFCLFPTLTELHLEQLNLDEHDVCDLLENLQFMPYLRALSVRAEHQGQARCYTTESHRYDSSSHRINDQLNLDGIHLTPETAAALGQSLPKMSSLQELEFKGGPGSVLQSSEMKALFGGFNKIMPLHKLTFSDFCVTGSLAPLLKNLRFFPNLREFKLERFNMDEHNQCALLENFGFIRDLTALSVRKKYLDSLSFHYYTSEENTLFNHRVDKRLNLDGINLTTTVVAALGQLLPEMPSLRELELTGMCEGILQAEEMKVLFGGFNKIIPLHTLKFSFSGFSVTCCLAPLTKSFRFFSSLRVLELQRFNMDEHHLISLLESLRFIPDLKTLSVWGKPLSQEHCCRAEVNTTPTPITNRTLERLNLDGISLTPAVAAALGRLLPELSSLETLELSGSDRSIVQVEEMEALFGGLNKTLPLYSLNFRGFAVTGCLAPLTKSFCFFPNLRVLYLGQLNMDERDVCSLLENLRLMRHLGALSVRAVHLGEACCYTQFTHQVNRLHLHVISVSPAVAAALGQLLTEMSSLQELEFNGWYTSSIWQSEELEALFGGIKETLPLTKLTISGFSVTGCLFPLIKSFRFFPDLRELELGGFLGKFNMDERHLFALMESLKFTPNLKTLSVKSKPLSQGHCCTEEVNTLAGITHKSLEKLKLDGINLTPAVAAALGQLLPEMSSLQQLQLTGADGSILKTKGIEALFGPLIKSRHFFPDLETVYLEILNIDEHDLCALLENCGLFRDLTALSINEALQEALILEISSSDDKRLDLDGMSIAPRVAAALGQLLSEMSTLKALELTGADESILTTQEMEALFGGFYKTLPLTKLTFSGFSVRGCLAPLIKSLQFLPDLSHINLKKLNMDEHDLCPLLESFQFIPHLSMLNLSHIPLGHAVRSIVPHISNMKKLRHLFIDETGPEEDLNYVRETVQQALPKLSFKFSHPPKWNIDLLLGPVV